jgi:hypothetical protein
MGVHSQNVLKIFLMKVFKMVRYYFNRKLYLAFSVRVFKTVFL